MGNFVRIRTNMSAIFTRRQIYKSIRQLTQAQERLASGLRINRAADDPAGLAISERMHRAQRGLSQAEKNAQDGISILQTAEGGLEAVGKQLQRIRELAVQAANDSLTDSDRKLIQEEISELVREIDRTASAVQFNNRQLLKSKFGSVDAAGRASKGKGSLIFQIGSNRNETIKITTDDIKTTTGKALGIRSGDGNEIEVTSRGLAESAIELATRAIDSISANRARVGAIQNRLEGTVRFLQIQQENVQSSRSRIIDADIAREAVRRTRAQILLQAGTAVLAQAQQAPRQFMMILGLEGF